MAEKGADALPDESVVAVTAMALLLKVPEAPLAGAVNATLAPWTGLPDESLTVTAKGIAKAVLIAVDCGVELAFAVIVAAAPARFVREKFTGVNPGADVITL